MLISNLDSDDERVESECEYYDESFQSNEKIFFDQILNLLKMVFVIFLSSAKLKIKTQK